MCVMIVWCILNVDIKLHTPRVIWGLIHACLRLRNGWLNEIMNHEFLATLCKPTLKIHLMQL